MNREHDLGRLLNRSPAHRLRGAPEGTCGVRAYWCLCTRAPHAADSPHVCGVAGCGGTWLGTWPRHDFQPVIYPGGTAA